MKDVLLDNHFIDTHISFLNNGKRKYSIYFRDSLLLLPSSLKKLGESFSVDVKKDIYPHLFLDNNRFII